MSRNRYLRSVLVADYNVVSADLARVEKRYAVLSGPCLDDAALIEEKKFLAFERQRCLDELAKINRGLAIQKAEL